MSTYLSSETASAQSTRTTHHLNPSAGRAHKPDHLRARMYREWGGDIPARQYATTAAAKMLVDALGARVGQFLALADNADIDEIMVHLHTVAAPAVQDVIAADNEPPLPLVPAAYQRLR